MARLHREKLRLLLDDIVYGATPPGTVLPREVDLAASFGVSRGVVREVMRAMEERGMVEIRHGIAGAVVAPSERWHILDEEVAYALLRGPERAALLAELVESRRVVEVEATRLAVQRASDDEVSGLVGLWERLRGLPKREHWGRGDTELDLHLGIMRATHNRALTAVATPVLDAFRPVANLLGSRTRSVQEHADVIAPLQYRDPDGAAEAMEAHLRALTASIRRRPAARSEVDRYSGVMATGGSLRRLTEAQRGGA